MAHYYRGELAHRKFLEAPVRLPDDRVVADLEAKRVLAVQAYDRWKESLGFKHAYWATASGYQMSQIFVELWEAHVKAPYPKRIDAATRPKYVAEVHDRVREHLEKALEGHRMNVELAKAYGVETVVEQGERAEGRRGHGAPRARGRRAVRYTGELGVPAVLLGAQRFDGSRHRREQRCRQRVEVVPGPALDSLSGSSVCGSPLTQSATTAMST